MFCLFIIHTLFVFFVAVPFCYIKLQQHHKAKTCQFCCFDSPSLPKMEFKMEDYDNELERWVIDNNIQTKSSRKKYQKLTESQTQVLETSFEGCPYPNKANRLKLGMKLGLEDKIVNYWFLKRRKSAKAEMERQQQGFLIEHSVIKEEIDVFHEGPSTSVMTTSEEDDEDDARLNKWMFLELALAGMDELMRLAQADSPLWSRSSGKTGEFLNVEEYKKTFMFPCVGTDQLGCFETEATRATATVMINGRAFVETLMDANRWKEMFPLNIRRATVLDVIPPPTDHNQDSTLQLMKAEFQIVSPLVPVRKMKFIRFCKQHVEGLWAVVDVSVDALFGKKYSNRVMSCRRLPSGCIVCHMPNGYSKVIWIEHTEYDENIVHHLYRPLIRSGLAFGAQKWIYNLQRQCVIMSMSSILSFTDVKSGNSAILRRSITKLAQRMTRSFCAGVRFAVQKKWELIHESDNTKMMITRDEGTAGNPGVPPRSIMSATTTVRMPVSPDHLLKFLQNIKTRCYWDALFCGGIMQQSTPIPTAQPDDLGNYACLFCTRVAPTSNGNPNSTLIFQEICTDASGSLLVYATVDAGMVSNGGGDILPSGFVIVPDCVPDSNGSLLTFGFQMLIGDLTAAQLTTESVDTLKTFIETTIQGIRAGLQCD